MKRIVQTMLVASSFTAGAFAMEFGTMGSHSFGMAGTGVALKSSPWGLYYNPALIAADDSLKFGFYLDGSTKGLYPYKTIQKVISAPSQATEGDLATISKAFNKPQSIGSNIGVVLQIPDFGIGSLAIGNFTSLKGGSAIRGTIPPVAQNYSLGLDFSFLFLNETALAYANSIYTPLGYFNVGVAVKYMLLSGLTFGGDFSNNVFSNIFSTLQGVARNGNQLKSFGVDVGIAYEPNEILTLAVVGKNLNTPTFKNDVRTFKIKPQVRVGASLDLSPLTLAIDADVMANQYLNSSIKNQMISVGGMVDIKVFALRAGVAKDLYNKDDLIFSVGLGLTIFDVGVQFGKKTSPYNGMQLPDYFALQVGAGFSF